MQSAEFERLFHSVAYERGERYVRARDRLVENGEALRSVLTARTEDPDWRRAFAGQVVLGWMDHAEEYRRFSGYLDGSIAIPLETPGSRMATQEPAMIRAASALKPDVIPRIVELLIKLDGFGPGSEYWRRLSQTIDHEPAFGEPLVAIMSDEQRPLHERLMAAHAIRLRYPDRAWRQFLHSVAWDEEASIESRRSAFAMLADSRFSSAEERERELIRVRTTLSDAAASEATLAALVAAVVAFEDRTLLDAALRLLHRARTGALRREVVLAAQSFETLQAFPDIVRVALSEADPALREHAILAVYDQRRLIDPSRAELQRALSVMRDPSSDEDALIFAAATLGRQRPDSGWVRRSGEVLLARLPDARSAAVQFEIVHALGALAHIPAIPAVERILEAETRDDIRRELEDALVQLTDARDDRDDP